MNALLWFVFGLTSFLHQFFHYYHWVHNNNNNNNNNNNIIIITLFMSQVYLAKHRGSSNWGDRKSNQHKSNQIKCWFLVRGETRSTWGKTSRSRVENQQTQPTYNVRSGNRTRATSVEGQCSRHCTNTACLCMWLLCND